MGYISILLFIIGFYSFLNKQKYYALIFICILSTNYFGFVEGAFLLGPISLQHGDLALLLIFALLPFRKNASSKELKGIQNALLLFFAFLAISVFYDYAVRGTSLMQIFRTTRRLGYLFFFFLINSFKWTDFKKVLKFLIVATSIHVFFYITQYIFGYSYTAHLDIIHGKTHLNESGGARYSNAPTYLIVVFVIILFSNFYKKYKLPLLLLFSVAILLGQSRGAIISMVSIYLLWLYLQKKIKMTTIVSIPIVVLAVFIVIQSYFPILGERFNNLFDQLALVRTMDYGNLSAFFHEGSFIFRWGLTYERFIYIWEEPIRIFLGAGFIPDMDVTRPIFTLGTYSPGLPTGFEQFNSVDIFFPNIITRYGILGSLFYIYFLLRILTFSNKGKKGLWGKITFTYLCSLVFISLVNETFYNGQNFLIIFVLVRLIVLERKKINHVFLQKK